MGERFFGILMATLCISLAYAASPFQIEEIEVTANKAHVQSEAFRLVAQVSHEEIETLPVTSIADILAYLPGLDVRSRGASEAQSDVSLRGGTFDQVLVLLNGVSISDAQTGHYTMNIPLSTDLIERIEVLQGTAANLIGAFSGAINIITRETPQDSYTMRLSAGTNGAVTPVFAGSWARNEVHINASAHYSRSDGYYAPEPNEKEAVALQNTDFQLADLYLQTRWRGMDVQVGAQWKDAGLGTGYGYASTDQFDATRTLFVSAAYQGTVAPHWSISSQVAYRANHDRYEWHRGSVTNRHWTHNTQAGFHAHYASRIGRTTFGAEFKNEYIRSSSMGEHNRWQATLSAEQQFIWRGLAASIGVAGHYNNRFGWYGSGAANIGYSFLKTGSVYIGATRSLRTPTWTDLYYKAGVQRGSKDLKAEKAWMVSLGGQYTWNWEKAGNLFIEGDVYYRWGSDIIDWNFNEADGLFYATNHNAVDAFGLDFTATYQWNKWLRTVSVRYAFSNLSLDLTHTKSMYLDYLRHKITVHIDHGIYVWSKGCVGADWSLRWQQREGTYVDVNGVPGNAFVPVLLLDGSIYVELHAMRFALSCTNMTNRHYYEYGGVLMPGTQGKISVTAQL